MPMLKRSLSAMRIRLKGARIFREDEEIIYPGEYRYSSPSLKESPPPGRTWIKHYNSEYYEIDSDLLAANTEQC
jgi:hypothetical protein